jgi:hypothetical protein
MVNTHRQGIGAWPNLRDLAKERRAEYITRANDMADDNDELEVAAAEAFSILFTSTSQSTRVELFVGDAVHEDSETSMDEFARPTPPMKRTRAHQRGLDQSFCHW